MLRIVPFFLAALLAACASPEEPDTVDVLPDDIGSDTSVGGTTDSTGTTDTETTLQGDYNGTIPPVALDAPDFLATNYDNTDRTRDDLIGQPTVMWFFPFSGTAG